MLSPINPSSIITSIEIVDQRTFMNRGYIATARIKTVGAKHSGEKSLSKSHKLSTRMLRPYLGIMP